MNIVEAIHDKRFFKPLFKDLDTWQNWIIFLKGLFGICIESKKDRKLFRKCTGLKRIPRKPAKEAFCICGRRSGKSFISAIIATFLACFKDWSEYLSPGENGFIFIIANDREQARIIKRYISGTMASQPVFRNLVQDDLQWEVRLKNNVIISVKTSSFKSVRGYTLLACICEEIAFWRDLDTAANPAHEILTALRPGMASIPESLLIGISTPYGQSGLLYENFKEHFGESESDSPLVWKAPTVLMNPTIPKAEIKRAFLQDKSSARAEWLAEFRTDLENFLPLELIEQAVVPGRVELLPMKDTKYFAFCDPSGGRQDSMTLAIAHLESTGKIIVDIVREAKPPFIPKEVVRDFSGILKSCGISLIKSDFYAGEWVSSSFADCGIMLEKSELTTSQIYLNVLPLMSNRKIELPENKRLISQLRSLERRTRSGGRDLVTHYPGGHDDIANAVCGAIVFTSKAESDLGFDEVFEKVMEKQEEENPLSMDEALADMEERSILWLLGGELEPPRDQNDESVNERRKTYTIKIEKIK